ncbi:hypothetical protein P692DRAFT_20690837, partial [Suillus brevipes Sb2]
TPAADCEPDKSGLKVPIENNLRSMVNETKQNPNITLANPLIRTAQRNWLSEEQVIPMKSIHNIAEEQFPIALKRKCQ